METHAAPLRNEDGAVVSHLAITRDVTERRRLQEEPIATQRREALGVMAGGIAHDFNGMLYVILGRSELALRKAGEGSPAARDLARSAPRRGAPPASPSRSSPSGGSLGEDRPVDLRETIDEALAMLRATLPRRSDPARRGDAPRTVFRRPDPAPPDRREPATNSAHAVRDKSDGEIELALEEIQIGVGGLVSAPYLAPGSYVRLRARDRGCGMPPEVRLRALEPYFSTKPPSEGSGLGLAVVDGIVRRLGGAVGSRASRVPGRPSTCCFPPTRGRRRAPSGRHPGSSARARDGAPRRGRRWSATPSATSSNPSAIRWWRRPTRPGAATRSAPTRPLRPPDHGPDDAAHHWRGARARAFACASILGDRLHRSPGAPSRRAREPDRHPRLPDQADRARAPRADDPRRPRGPIRCRSGQLLRELLHVEVVPPRGDAAGAVDLEGAHHRKLDPLAADLEPVDPLGQDGLPVTARALISNSTSPPG